MRLLWGTNCHAGYAQGGCCEGSPFCRDDVGNDVLVCGPTLGSQGYACAATSDCAGDLVCWLGRCHEPPCAGEACSAGYVSNGCCQLSPFCWGESGGTTPTCRDTCAPLASYCLDDTDCCPGLVCSYHACVERASSCASVGESCSHPNECCSSWHVCGSVMEAGALYCKDGCSYRDWGCATDQDCCEDLRCIDNICQSLCLLAGDLCFGGGCCPGLGCQGNICIPGEDCSGLGQQCSEALPCCDPMTCANSACQAPACSHLGEACSYEHPCCGSSICDRTGRCASDASPVCPDGVCGQAETCQNCSADRGACDNHVCGDQTCTGPETCSDCPGDCGACGHNCGDSLCRDGETCENCPQDCGECAGPRCGDAECQGGETCSSCSLDCGSCGGQCSGYIVGENSMYFDPQAGIGQPCQPDGNPQNCRDGTYLVVDGLCTCSLDCSGLADHEPCSTQGGWICERLDAENKVCIWSGWNLCRK